MATTSGQTAAGLYATLGLRWIPRLLAMVDRNRLGPTYGCFDREYWHYRTADFACGMHQLYGLPLAAACVLDVPGNPWHGQARLRELALAAVAFAARTAHRDGSCDDYFPYERALGATSFALFGCAESCRLLGCTDRALLEHLVRRARFVAGYQETGHLSNHQALAALGIYLAGTLAGDEALVRAARERAELTLSWQHGEGWFQEYEGCDPGYLTLTIAFLAKLRRASGWAFLDEPLARAAECARWFVHPDGSYGGEYGSRNTFHYMADGFELLGPTVAAAREVADGWLWGAAHGHNAAMEDDRVFAHPVCDLLLAARTVSQLGDRALPTQPPALRPGVQDLHGAGLLVVHEGEWHLVIALNKGGVFKAWRGEALVASDTGLAAGPASGERWLVSHMVHATADGDDAGSLEVDAAAKRAVVETPLAWTRRRLASPLKQIAFRVVTGTVGRVAPNLIRKTIQRLLITGKRWAPYRLRREFDWSGERPVVTDTLMATGGAPPIARLYRSTDATSIYVAHSNAGHESMRLAWEDLSACLPELRGTGRVTIIRELGR